MPDISIQLKDLRKSKGWTQQNLADLAGLSKNTVYNLEKGQNATQKSLQSLAAALDVSVEQLVKSSDDAISSGPFGFRARLNRRLSLSPLAFPIDKNEVRDAATNMVAGFIEDYSAANDRQTWNEFAEAYEALDAHWEAIVESYVRAWKQSAASFLFAVESDQRVGLASNWPISGEAYERFRRGELAFFDFTEEMIQPGSQNILVNSAFEFPGKRKPFFEVTDSLFHLILYQLGTQSRNAWSDSFRMVCFTGTPLNQKRAIANGFEPLGVRMPKVPFPLFEFAVDANAVNPERNFTQRMLRGVAGAFSPEKLKRNALRAAVSAYQYAFKHQPDKNVNRAG